MSRSPAAILFDLAGNAIDSVLRATVRRLAISVESEEERDDIYFANMIKLGAVGSEHFLLIDVDGVGYKHPAGTKAKLVAVRAGAVKSNSGSKWSLRLGTVLAITPTEAIVGYSIFAGVNLQDSSALSATTDVETLFPVYLDLEVSAGDFVRITTAIKVTETGINTAGTLPNAAGTPSTPAVGDVVLSVLNISGGGTLDYAYSTAYVVK